MSKVAYENLNKNVEYRPIRKKTLKYQDTWMAVENMLDRVEKRWEQVPWVLTHQENQVSQGYLAKNFKEAKVWRFFSNEEELETYLKSFRQEGS